MADLPITKTEEELEKKLGEIRLQGTEDEYRAKATKLGLPFSDLKNAPIDVDALIELPEATAQAARMAIIMKNGRRLTAALIDPESEETKKALADLRGLGFTVTVIMTSPSALAHILDRYKTIKTDTTFEVGSIDVSPDELDQFQKQIKDLSSLKTQISGVSATKLLEILLAGALKIGASDVHFEPETEHVRLRYRLDGVLQDVTAVDTHAYNKVLSRIKVLSHLKLNIHTAPQDGRFTIHQQAVDIEVRVSILPSEYGETVVMRLLDPRTVKNGLEELGLRPDMLELIKAQLGKPNGAILTTGPTGSGKTTTLYAFLNYLNESGSKIITIEDPIEYHIGGISQTQVEPDKGYDFSNGLRAIVRQDPDIILVGEIRDAETAEIALNAALTGHLVLSTIHTNDAAGTVPRLIDLKVNPQIIAPAIHMAMAQRLVRILCPSCKKTRAATAEEQKLIEDALSPLTDRLKLPGLKTIRMPEAVGCAACNNTGYKGRVGVFEAFVITPEMEKMILSNPSVSGIRDLAMQQGMITMQQDAYLKLLAGQTDLSEIRRIVG